MENAGHLDDTALESACMCQWSTMHWRHCIGVSNGVHCLQCSTVLYRAS